MKRLMTLSLGLLLATGTYAQYFGDVVNTVAERLTFTGYAQAGYNYHHQYETTNSFELTRVSLTIKAQVTDNLLAVIDLDPKNGKLTEFYTDYSIRPYFKVKFGQFKTPYTFENQLSSAAINLINGGSQAMRYYASTDGSDIMNYKSSGRDIGLMIHGDILYGIFSYKLAVMNGQGYNASDKNKNKDFSGALDMNLGDNITFGGSYILGKGHAINTNAALGIYYGDNYTRNRWALSARYKSDLFDLTTEYMAGKDGKYRSKGAYATSAIHVTPKLDVILSYDYFNSRKFNAPPVSPLATDLDLPESLRGEIKNNYIAGLQYWFYPKCRLQVQYLYNDSHIEKNKSSLMAQLQIAF